MDFERVKSFLAIEVKYVKGHAKVKIEGVFKTQVEWLSTVLPRELDPNVVLTDRFLADGWMLDHVSLTCQAFLAVSVQMLEISWFESAHEAGHIDLKVLLHSL